MEEERLKSEMSRPNIPIVSDTLEVEALNIEQIEQFEQLEAQPLPAKAESVEIEVVVAGYICLNIMPALTGNDASFQSGHQIEAGKVTLTTGGSVSNTGLILHKLGINTRLMGKVGNDLFGQAIFQIIEEHGPELVGGMIIASGEDSSYSIILSAPEIERVIIHAPGCNNTFVASDIRYDLLELARLLHFGNPSLMARMYHDEGAELARVFRRAKLHGVTTSLDLCMSNSASNATQADWWAILRATLPYVDIFLPGIEELLLILRRPLFDQLTAQAAGNSITALITPTLVAEMGQHLLQMGAKMVGIKVGRRGLYLRTADDGVLATMGLAQPISRELWTRRELWVPHFVPQMMGTFPANDTINAGFLFGLLRDMTPEATLRIACAAGACSLETLDAISDIQRRPRLRTPQDGQFVAANWLWDVAHEVWIGPEDMLRASL